MPSLCVFHPIWVLGGGPKGSGAQPAIMQFSSLSSSVMVVPHPSSRCLAEGNRIFFVSRTTLVNTGRSHKIEGTAHQLSCMVAFMVRPLPFPSILHWWPFILRWNMKSRARVLLCLISPLRTAPQVRSCLKAWRSTPPNRMSGAPCTASEQMVLGGQPPFAAGTAADCP